MLKREILYMINEQFDVITLEAVRCEQAEIITVKESREIKRKHKKEALWKKVDNPKGGIIDFILRQSAIIIFILAMVTAINFIGFDAFIQNVRQVIEYQSMGDFFSNVLFV